ncbi:MAG: 1-deoxy-D-xylulose-5-phosphate reductoisomerase [Planctomycetes bacterium]|nr:1-deoxy-D-xylulose-5-phosphate reductoisomerase [Planctomycetota bacterium]
MKKKIILLGATGSIGQSTLEVVRRLRPELELVALAAGSNWQGLLEAAREFRPLALGLCDPKAAEALLKEFQRGPWEPAPRVYTGMAGLAKLVQETPADIVLGAISGAAGLPATLAAVESGKHLALANKEALVMAGSILTRRAKELDRQILPVDSEHSAIFQSLQAGDHAEVRRIHLTASGGPFRNYSREQMAHVTPAQALRHPTWKMGAKITIDSATLMNKALEIIEAHWLFQLPPQKIKVVIHPQSVIHSLVEFVDGSTICQLGPPDMKIPIQYALTYPQRREMPPSHFSLADIGQLTFEPPDEARFPSLRLAYRVLEDGGTASSVFNAANEAAVDLFLKEKLAFLRIFDIVEEVLGAHRVIGSPSLEDLFDADRWAREEVRRRAG